MLPFREKLHLKTAFSYKTIEQSHGNPTVHEILDEVFELTQLPIRDLEEEFGPDTSEPPPQINRTMRMIGKKTKPNKAMTRFW